MQQALLSIDPKDALRTIIKNSKRHLFDLKKKNY